MSIAKRLVAILLLAFTVNAADTRADETVVSGDPTAAKRFKVYLVTWRGCEFACKGFIAYFKTQRIDADIIHRDAGRDKTKMPGFVAEAKNMKVDLVVTWGTTTALSILGTYQSADPAKHITEIPAMFMIVSQPVGVRLVKDFGATGRNITGTIYLVPEETQLKLARSYRPFKKMAVIYNPAEKNSVLSVQNLKAIADKEGWALLDRPVPTGTDGKPATTALPALVAELAAEKPEWFYQGPDSFLNVNRDLFTSEAVKNGIPVFAAGENPVRTSNALLGVVNRYYNVGQFTGARAEQVLLRGIKPGDMPIDSPSRFSVIINMKTAKNLQLYPPLNLLKFSDVITE
jgi:putative ABC transport system substrate-binding protein